MKLKFNYFRNGKMIILINFCLSLFSLSAQNSPDPEPGAVEEYKSLYSVEMLPPSCLNSQVKNVSIIHYSDMVSVSVEIANTEFQSTSVFIQDNEGRNQSDALTPRAGGLLTFENLKSNQSYELKGINSCGQVEVIANINTLPFKPGEAVVTSAPLYRALSAYVASERQSIPLPEYVKGLPEISLQEKIEFAQRYFMNGALLPSKFKNIYPDDIIKDAIQTRKTEGDCLCNFVMNEATIVVPDETVNDYDIKERVENQEAIAYNSSSQYWRASSAKGAAKYHQLWSDGWKAGNQRRTTTWTTTSQTPGENKSDYYAKIGYHLLCVGYNNNLPEGCDCEKEVKYDFSYSTDVSAFGKTLNGVWNREAAAQAQDWAVVLATREKVNSTDDVQILQAGLASAVSECSGGVSPAIIGDALKIGYSVFKVIKSVKTGNLSGLDEQVGDVIDKVSDIITKTTEVKDCSNAVNQANLLQGGATFKFHPNDPMSVILMSGSALEVKGLRSWQSTARVLSSFHLSGVVQGGSPTPTTSHCCTNYFGNWAFASYENKENSLRNKISGHLALNSPGGWQVVNNLPNNGSNSVYPATEIGFAIGVQLPEGETCKKEIPIFNHPN